ncbi:hypothetical protein [Protaetiibacter mangrovi]|uniref:Uncharacterized protein n=1 Tax=Protaetiibacter mangrovi TaxID=2970926 RepID=A0ABT1ZFV9_9MICO|nr:hypothetical protein [Protaetiibacter mangrovi]MCS0499604.1 hypothetical protein [Protaetiibacter mangrovi]TPX05841.1 hypothetical protein FJ656_04360 [Schumannella luteola]
MVTYEIVLPYARSDRLAAAFPEFACADLARQRTVLVGELHDQAELHSVLNRLADLGLELDQVRRIDTATQGAPS